MSSPFVGEIRAWGCNFAPRNWMTCDGQLLPIQQYTALFSLLGTFYGGNGTTNFQLPDLRGRVPIKFGTAVTGDIYNIGEQGGVESVQLNLTEMPGHSHGFLGTSAAADDKRPRNGSAFAQSTSGGTSPADAYYGNGPQTVLNQNTVSPYLGSGLPHTNVQPYLTINWCIATAGIFPSRN
jgi:microcystin-dependent protein